MPDGQGQVLSERVEVQTDATMLPTETPSFTPSPSPTETASPSPTPTAQPISKTTVKPTSKPTLTPTPTTTSTPSPTPSLSPVVTSTPSPTPIPTLTTNAVATFTDEQISSLYNKYGAEYGVSSDLLRHIAECESGSDPFIINPAGPYVGLYQFGGPAWANYRSQMGLDTNPALRTNAEEAVRTAAFVLKKNEAYIWPKCVLH